jgi:hypothetical protein
LTSIDQYIRGGTSFDLVDLFQSGKFSKNFEVKPPGELNQVQMGLDTLLVMLKHLTAYVDDVIVNQC